MQDFELKTTFEKTKAHLTQNWIFEPNYFCLNISLSNKLYTYIIRVHSKAYYIPFLH